jgi:hypothetical protein
MTAEEVNTVLSSNREMVISFFNENVKVDNFYTLRWFMIRVLNEATLSWARRKNIGEKEIQSVLSGVMRNYPQISKGHVSNYAKAVNYFGKEKANQILNAK